MTIGLTLLLLEDTAGFDEATIGLDEDTAGFTELLLILLELESLEGEIVGFKTVGVEILDDVVTFGVDEDVEIFLVDDEEEPFLVDEEEEIFLVVEDALVGLAVDLTELVTRAGVAVTALQT